MEELQAGQQEATDDGGDDLRRVRVGALLHPRDERDRAAAEHGEDGGLQAEGRLDVVPTGLDELAVPLRERLHDEPHHDPPAGEVGEQGADPQPEQLTDRALPGDEGRDGNEEVLGEELAVRQVERDEPDAERQAREEVAVGLVQDGEVPHHPEADLQSAREAGRQHDPGRALQAFGALLDDRVEGLVDLVLHRGVAAADLAASVVGHRSDASPVDPAPATVRAAAGDADLSDARHDRPV